MNKKTINFPVIIFFCSTYLISWLLWVPQIILKKEIFLLRIGGTFSPLISAIIISNIIGGKKSVKALLKPLLIWKFNIVWYLFCLFSTVVLCFSAIGIAFSLKVTQLTFNELSKIYLVIPIFFYVLFTSVIGEETGWRGFALPLLQKQFGATISSIIIGLIWGFWHLPLFFIEGNFHQTLPFWIFLIQEIALSIVITWIYNNTKKSLLSVHIFHTASNITLGLLPILPMDTNGDMRPLYITVILLVILAICIVLSKSINGSTENNSILK